MVSLICDAVSFTSCDSFRYYWSYGYYREPGNAGYSVDDPLMDLHLQSCVDKETGVQVECRLQVGDNYIQCAGGNQSSPGNCSMMVPCPSQPECAIVDGSTKFPAGTSCGETVWCRQYTIQTATMQNVANDTNISSSSVVTNLGYLPLTDYCHTDTGKFSQELGVIVPTSGNSTTLGNCYYADGVTLVQRHLAGAYAFCGGQVCNTTFVGGYESDNYDPRYRPWYIATKEKQVPNWSPPYPFFELGIGVTYSHPIYETLQDGRRVFAGVLAIDYRCALSCTVTFCTAI